MHPTLQRGTSAELLVAYRFIAAGRRVCWPLVLCGYDLVVDTGNALLRVQVKQASETESDGWQCRLQKSHPVQQGVDYAGRYDYVCVVTTPNEIYVIPEAGLRAAHAPDRVVASITVGKTGRFAPYLNQFSLGAGEFTERVCSELVELSTPKRRMWFQRDNSSRKSHRRLSREQVIALQSLPIRMTRNDPEQPDGVPIEQVAQQFGVHVATIRNLLRGKRKDLQADREVIT